MRSFSEILKNKECKNINVTFDFAPKINGSENE